MNTHIKNLMLVLAATAISASADMSVFANIDKAIPDNSGFGVQDTQSISGYGPAIESVSVYLKLDAAAGDFAYNGDYYVSLQHDSGFSVLLNRTGRTAGNSFGYGDNGFVATFSFGSNDVHNYQSSSYALDSEDRLTGTWGADGRNIDPDLVVDTDSRSALLDSFNGLDPNGDWTLFVADMSQNGNGSIDEWGLDISTIPEPSSLVMAGVAFGLGLFIRRRFSR